MATVELAACLPVLVVVLGAALTALAVVSGRVRAQDGAREAARAAARGDLAVARRLAADAAPGSTLSVAASGTGEGGTVTATVRLTVRPLGDLLPAFTVTARATAATEPLGDDRSAAAAGAAG
ncbi:TadE family type IV pilus minor pilin [Jatrophihabitans fulvus]